VFSLQEKYLTKQHEKQKEEKYPRIQKKPDWSKILNPTWSK